MHTCRFCGKTPEETPFYKGMTNRCKECHKVEVRRNRAENVDFYRSYDAKRFKDDPRVKERQKRYFSTDAGKAAVTKSKKKWQSGNPDKRAAHILLNNAVKRGKIEKPEICENCGFKSSKPRSIHAHHEDYTKPLEVKWLCVACHKREHFELVEHF
jgi:hypothetical protein